MHSIAMKMELDDESDNPFSWCHLRHLSERDCDGNLTNSYGLIQMSSFPLPKENTGRQAPCSLSSANRCVIVADVNKNN